MNYCFLSFWQIKKENFPPKKALQKSTYVQNGTYGYGGWTFEGDASGLWIRKGWLCVCLGLFQWVGFWGLRGWVIKLDCSWSWMCRKAVIATGVHVLLFFIFMWMWDTEHIWFYMSRVLYESKSSVLLFLLHSILHQWKLVMC